MTRADIIRMAREAWGDLACSMQDEPIQFFANKVAAAAVDPSARRAPRYATIFILTLATTLRYGKQLEIVPPPSAPETNKQELHHERRRKPGGV